MKPPEAAETSISTTSHRRLGAAGLLGLLLVWWGITTAGWVEPLFLPSPGQVLAALWRLHRQGYMGSSLGSHVLASLQRLLAALLASLASALTLGLAMGLLPRLRAVIDPAGDRCSGPTRRRLSGATQSARAAAGCAAKRGRAALHKHDRPCPPDPGQYLCAFPPACQACCRGVTCIHSRLIFVNFCCMIDQVVEAALQHLVA